MLLDAQNIFSDNQSITEESVNSTNIVAFGKGDISYLPLFIVVSEDFNDATDLTVSIQTADNAEFSTPKTLAKSTLELKELKTGKRFPLNHLPSGCEGYIRLLYTTTGTQETKGRITAGVTAGNEYSWHDM